MRKNKKRTKRLILVLTVLAAIVVAGAAYAAVQNQKVKKQRQSQTKREKTENASFITYQGKKYEYNLDLRTILFLGVDKNEEVMVKEITGRSGQTDSIILLVLDTQEKTTTLLEVSRDTMTDVKVYGMDGDYLSTETAQIATQYAYGDGERRSCQLSRDAVSNLLYQIPIHDYLSLNMAGIGPITDQIGGIEIMIPEDYTMIDPLFVQGSTVVLNGEQAERYVRYRDTEMTGSNNQRMERQTQFIQALLAKVRATEDGGDAMLQQFWSVSQPYITTDLTLDMLKKVSSYSLNPEILTIPGTMQKGQEHDEFYVEETALQQMIMDIFYKEVKEG